MDSNKKRRNLSVEYLRLFFMFLIVQLHIMQYGYGEEFIINDTSTNSYIQLPLIAIGKLGVPGFIFISGYYGIKLKSKRLLSLWCQTTFYAALSVILTFVVFGTFSFKECICTIVSIFYKWWFVEYYVFLMLLAPILNKGIELLPPQKYSLIVAVLIFYIYGVLWFNTRYSACSLLQFISVYVIGRYLALYPIQWLKDHCISLCLISIVSLIILTDMIHFTEHVNWIKYVITYYNILVLTAVISLFMICNKYTIYGKENFITQNCLAIYLIHSNGFFYKILMDYFQRIPFNYLVVLGDIVIVILACLLIEEVRKKSFRKLEEILYIKMKSIYCVTKYNMKEYD